MVSKKHTQNIEQIIKDYKGEKYQIIFKYRSGYIIQFTAQVQIESISTSAPTNLYQRCFFSRTILV